MFGMQDSSKKEEKLHLQWNIVEVNKIFVSSFSRLFFFLLLKIPVKSIKRFRIRKTKKKNLKPKVFWIKYFNEEKQKMSQTVEKIIFFRW